jgi:plasmid maintenance system antidote protein VapI
LEECLVSNSIKETKLFVLQISLDTDWYKSMQPLLTPGKALRVYRENAGLTQEALGAKLGGVPRQHISGMETGRRPVGKEMAKRLATALDTSPMKFIQI